MQKILKTTIKIIVYSIATIISCILLYFVPYYLSLKYTGSLEAFNFIEGILALISTLFLVVFAGYLAYYNQDKKQ